MTGIPVIFILFVIGNVVDESFGIFPAKAGIGNGSAVDTFAHLLAAFFDIAFNHDTLNQLVNIGA